jgi:hypothetical protein
LPIAPQSSDSSSSAYAGKPSDFEETEMKKIWSLIATIGLGTILFFSGPNEAFAWRDGYGGGWHGVGWRGGWGGGGWGGGGWGWNRPGWGGGGWAWNRPGWGWNRGWGWGGGFWPGAAGFGLGWAASSPYYYGGPSYSWGYGSPYYNYGISSYYPNYYGGYQTPYYTARTTVPVTGRSVAAGNIGMRCATTVRTCLLRNASYVGGGCSCAISGGRARGSVIP